MESAGRYIGPDSHEMKVILAYMRELPQEIQAGFVRRLKAAQALTSSIKAERLNKLGNYYLDMCSPDERVVFLGAANQPLIHTLSHNPNPFVLPQIQQLHSNYFSDPRPIIAEANRMADQIARMDYKAYFPMVDPTLSPKDSMGNWFITIATAPKLFNDGKEYRQGVKINGKLVVGTNTEAHPLFCKGLDGNAIIKRVQFPPGAHDVVIVRTIVAYENMFLQIWFNDIAKTVQFGRGDLKTYFYKIRNGGLARSDVQ